MSKSVSQRPELEPVRVVLAPDSEPGCHRTRSNIPAGAAAAVVACKVGDDRHTGLPSEEEDNPVLPNRVYVCDRLLPHASTLKISLASEEKAERSALQLVGLLR